MKYCSNCGAEVKEGQAICLSCGFALKESAVKADVKADPVPAKDYSNRVKHDVLKAWPNFTDGPIGRMEYFISFLKLLAVSLALTFIFVITQMMAESNPLAAIPLLIFAIVGIVAALLIFVQNIAIVYKRFWDMGFEDIGVRIGMTIGYFFISLVPFLNITCFAMFFVPGKGKVEA